METHLCFVRSVASKVRYTSEVTAAIGVVHMLLIQNFCVQLNALVIFRKVRRKSNFAQVGAEYTFGELCVYIQGGPVENRTATH